MRRTRLGLAAVSVVVLVIGGGAAVGADFNDPTTANVLHEYDTDTWAKAVTETYTSAGTYFGRHAANDGSGWNDEANGGWQSADTWVQKEFTLAGARNVGSFMAQFDGGSRRPGRFLLEGFDGTSWVTVADVADPATTYLTGSFTADGYEKIRYTAYGGHPNSDTHFGLNELQVYRGASDTVGLGEGYSFFRDQAPSSIYSTNKTVGGTMVWKQPNNNGSALRDANFHSDLKCQSPSGDGERAFVAYTFAEARQMDFGTLGGGKGQGFAGNWEIYTASGAMPDLQALDANDSATIQGAGWTVQYAYTGTGFAQAQEMIFANPGEYDYLALVWDVQWANEVQLELFAAPEAPYIPEPATMVLLAISGAGLLLRRRRQRV